MRKTIFLFVFISAALILASCNSMAPIKSTDPCVGKGRWSGVRGNLYTPVSQSSCGYTIRPFDVSSWLESPKTSYKLRGFDTVRIGCGSTTPRQASCDVQTSPGQSQTVKFNFNFTEVTSTARVQKAMLFIFVEENPELMLNASVKARLNIGSGFANVANNPQLIPQGRRGSAWVTYDITGFAGRAIQERRASASFEISLPCNRPEMPGSLISLRSREPFIVVEYQ